MQKSDKRTGPLSPQAVAELEQEQNSINEEVDNDYSLI